MTPSTHDLLKAAAAHMTPTYNAPPLVVARGAGAHVWDLDGRQYLDFAGGMGVNMLGHGHPQVVRAIAAQSEQLCHTSNALLHQPGIEMCARLAQMTPGCQVFLCNSGTEAVEAALKLARRYFLDRGTPRTGFISTHNSFHGRSYGAMSITGQDAYRKGFDPLVPDVQFVPFNDLPAVEHALTDSTAAVVVEPIQGNGGVLVPSPGYLQALQQLCTQRGALLILDEVQTGIGRTGKWFAYQHEAVVPDILCLAKALGGGLPLGAMLTRDALATTFKPGVHGTTFGGNPVACAAGLATLQVIDSQGLLQRATLMGNKYRSMLQGLSVRFPQIREVRGRGLLIGLLFDRPIKELQQACIKQGMFTTAAGSHVMRLFPPLTVSDGELEHSIEILQQALS